jgi:hypothetical protein
VFDDFYSQLWGWFNDFFQHNEEDVIVLWRGLPRRARYCHDCHTFEWLEAVPTWPALPPSGAG